MPSVNSVCARHLSDRSVVGLHNLGRMSDCDLFLLPCNFSVARFRSVELNWALEAQHFLKESFSVCDKDDHINIQMKDKIKDKINHWNSIIRLFD